MNIKKELFKNSDKGTEKEVEVNGVKLIVRSPNMEDIYIIVQILRSLGEGNGLDVKSLAQVAINNTFAEGSNELLFDKADLEQLLKDRSGILGPISYALYDFAGENINIEKSKKN